MAMQYEEGGNIFTRIKKTTDKCHTFKKFMQINANVFFVFSSVRFYFLGGVIFVCVYFSCFRSFL